MLKLKQIGEDLNAYVFSFGNELLEEARTAFSSTLAGNLSKPQNAALLAGGKAHQIEINTSQHKYFLIVKIQKRISYESNFIPAYGDYLFEFKKNGIDPVILDTAFRGRLFNLSFHQTPLPSPKKQR